MKRLLVIAIAILSLGIGACGEVQSPQPEENYGRMGDHGYVSSEAELKKDQENYERLKGMIDQPK